MRPCRACGTANDDNYRFCGTCGASLGGARCATCGFVNASGQRFCGQCGGNLTTDRPAPVAVTTPADERKLATVLFADVVGFTTLAEHADPEAIAAKVDAAFRRLAAIVTSHGGTVDKYMGDCLMAMFGVPSAHDDDA
ncbi:MAG: hypothetical protein QOG64_2656, partial [Acidimicrobiaceae bacterium]|nr:hypothetical protein [Acidimicrobiaceae bacterium]